MVVFVLFVLRWLCWDGEWKCVACLEQCGATSVTGQRGGDDVSAEAALRVSAAEAPARLGLPGRCSGRRGHVWGRRSQRRPPRKHQQGQEGRPGLLARHQGWFASTHNHP